MTLSAVYDPTLSRIELNMTAAVGVPVTALFDRSTDGVTWTTVRGGADVTADGDDAGPVYDYEFPAGVLITYRVRGYDASEVLTNTDTTTITQDLDDVWLKVPAAPFLNQPVIVWDRSEVTRKSRAGVFNVVGRSNPVMVGDVASSIAYTLVLQTTTLTEEENLDYLFASGEVVFLQLPSTVEYLQGGYFAVGDVSRDPVSKVSAMRRWNVPLTGVAAPGPNVVGSAYTWTSAVAEYATWSALIADNLTWADLLERTGSPSDVIVP